MGGNYAEKSVEIDQMCRLKGEDKSTGREKQNKTKQTFPSQMDEPPGNYLRDQKSPQNFYILLIE